jgi:Domain of unknown function (DUF4189)
MYALRPYRAVVLGLIVAAAGLCWLAAPASARADDTYAAIAYSENTGRYGYGYGFSSRSRAEAEALNQCEGDDAQVVIWGRNAYVALAISDNGPYGYAWGTTAATAKRIALQKCRDYGGENARIVVSVYSGD